MHKNRAAETRRALSSLSFHPAHRAGLNTETATARPLPCAANRPHDLGFGFALEVLNPMKVDLLSPPRSSAGVTVTPRAGRAIEVL